MEGVPPGSEGYGTADKLLNTSRNRRESALKPVVRVGGVLSNPTFDHHIGGATRHDEVFDTVATDQDEATASVDVRLLHHIDTAGRARLERPAPHYGIAEDEPAYSKSPQDGAGDPNP